MQKWNSRASPALRRHAHTWVAILLGALTLEGCATPAFPPPMVIDSRYISKVQDDLKRQIGLYNSTVSFYRAHPDQDPWKAAGVKYACGDGSIDFNIASVKLDIMTSSEEIDRANAGSILPISQIVFVTPSGTISRDTTNVQELQFTEWTAKESAAPPPLLAPDFKTSQIALALLDLRGGLITSAQAKVNTGPAQCFLDYDPTKADDAPHSYKLGVAAIHDVSRGIALSVAILNVGGGVENKSTGQNTITVNFRQARDNPGPNVGLELVAPPQDTGSSCGPLPTNVLCIGGKPVYQLNGVMSVGPQWIKKTKPTPKSKPDASH